jgi:hypothetical protein
MSQSCDPVQQDGPKTHPIRQPPIHIVIHSVFHGLRYQ